MKKLFFTIFCLCNIHYMTRGLPILSIQPARPLITPTTAAITRATSATTMPNSTPIQATMATLHIGPVNIKNTSTFPASLSAITIAYANELTPTQKEFMTLHLPDVHPVPAKPSKTKVQIKRFEQQFPMSVYYQGISSLTINGQQVSLDAETAASGYDTIYITSTNGTTWTIDTAATNKATAKAKNKATATTTPSSKIKAATTSIMTVTTKTKKSLKAKNVAKN